MKTVLSAIMKTLGYVAPGICADMVRIVEKGVVT
jgi:hypothetical protein